LEPPQNPGRFKFIIIEAFTTDLDGNKTEVTPDKVVTQQSPQSASAPMFADVLVKTIVFPNVQIGSVLAVHTKRINKKPIFAGYFSITETFSQFVHYLSASVTFKAPKSLNIYIDADQLDGGIKDTKPSDFNQWTWTLGRKRAYLPERGSVSEKDFSPYVAITNIETDSLFIQSYVEQSKSQTLPTVAIQKLADQITLGITDRNEQSQALYYWVSKEIRYVAIYLGLEGWVPRSVEDIVATRYGDCKDHVALLQALLAAKNISSSPALINASNSYKLPKVPAYINSFDHIINYIPEFKLFVDSTSQTSRYGVLPAVLRGKQALVADVGDGRSSLMRTPLYQPEKDAVVSETELTLAENGNWNGVSRVTTKGVFDSEARYIFGIIPERNTAQFANSLLIRTGQSGTGSYQAED